MKIEKTKSSQLHKFYLVLLVAISFLSIVLYINYKSRKNILGLETSTPSIESVLTKQKLLEADKYLNVTPNPIEKIQTEGKLDSNPLKIKSEKSLEDVNKFYQLSFAYKLSSDKKYLQKSKDIIISWAKVNKAVGNPIDETRLTPFFIGYMWIKDSFSEQEKVVVNSWIRSVVNKEISLKYNDDRDINNWNSHRINILGQAGFALEDQKIIDYSLGAFKSHLEKNLNPDGSSFDFVSRDALSYHCYDLLPLLTYSKTVMIKNNINLYVYNSSKGSSLQKSVNFLIPYVNGEKNHSEFVNSKAEWDKKTSDSGQQKSKKGRSFAPKEAIGTIEEAYFFDNSLESTIQKALNKKNKYPTTGTFVNYILYSDLVERH